MKKLTKFDIPTMLKKPSHRKFFSLWNALKPESAWNAFKFSWNLKCFQFPQLNIFLGSFQKNDI